MHGRSQFGSFFGTLRLASDISDMAGKIMEHRFKFFDCNDVEVTPTWVSVLDKALDQCYNVRYMSICWDRLPPSMPVANEG